MIIFKDYNDFELLYMIRHEGSEEALNIMLEKYMKFIGKKITSFKIYPSLRDDYMQEGLLCLYKTIYDYDDKYEKTFLRFFELCLDRRFIHLGKKIAVYNKTFDSYCQNYAVERGTSHNILIKEEVSLYQAKSFKSDKEKYIYEEYFLKNQKIEEIEKLSGYSRKTIYNTICRIKNKLK